MTDDASGTLFRQRCEFCGAAVSTLRRGRCWGCYQRWQDSQTVGLGATCVICRERRLGHLQRVELFGRWLPLCHDCAARSRHLLPMPASVDGIRKALSRERREGERRDGGPDTRLDPTDRRGPDRRAIPLADSDLELVGDLPASEIAELALDLVFEPPAGEATLIYDRLAPSELAERTVRRAMPPPTPPLAFEEPEEKVVVEVVERQARRRLGHCAITDATAGAIAGATASTTAGATATTPVVEAAAGAEQEGLSEKARAEPTAAPQDERPAESSRSAPLPGSLRLGACLPLPAREPAPAQAGPRDPAPALTGQRDAAPSLTDPRGGLVLFELPMPSPQVPWRTAPVTKPASQAD